jgi:hypothetical protein
MLLRLRAGSILTWALAFSETASTVLPRRHNPLPRFVRILRAVSGNVDGTFWILKNMADCGG